MIRFALAAALSTVACSSTEATPSGDDSSVSDAREDLAAETAADTAVEAMSHDTAVDETSGDTSVEETPGDASVDETPGDAAVEETSGDAPIEETSRDAAADTAHCCPIGERGCCMLFGGSRASTYCGLLCDNIPIDLERRIDDAGCPYWYDPPGGGITCNPWADTGSGG